MKRARSSSRELWIAIGLSLVFHVLAGSVFWITWERTMPDDMDMETEWTWTAPAPEQKTQGRSAPESKSGAVSPSASDAAGLGEASPAEKLPGSAAGTTTAPVPVPAYGTGQGKNGPVRGGSAGGGPTTGGSPVSPGSTSGALQGSESPFAGDSTGLALVPPKIRERPAIRLPAEALQAGLSGNVLLLVEVLEDGRVGKIVVSRPSGAKILDESAKENVSRWRFDPAWDPQGKKPVRVMTSVWVRYTKEGS